MVVDYYIYYMYTVCNVQYLWISKVFVPLFLLKLFLKYYKKVEKSVIVLVSKTV